MSIKQSLFETLGYTRDDEKPAYKTYGLLKVKDNLWTVIEASHRGGITTSMRTIIAPTIKMFAVEAYKVALAKYISRVFDE